MNAWDLRVSCYSFCRERVKGSSAADTKTSDNDHYAGAGLGIPLYSLPEIRPGVQGQSTGQIFPRSELPQSKLGIF